MKVCIAGSRPPKGSTPEETTELMKTMGRQLILHESVILKDVTEVVSGAAIGADQVGEAWARFWNIHIKEFKPDWTRYGNSAGHRRNAEMADYCDYAVVLWDGKSRGSLGMINQMRHRKKMCFILFIGDH